ncbi:endoribonuclease L-PSP [Cunninghamella echinulata]|nr:endoribonuclease L-PSP [Cunninghamella echinulata]
MSLARVQTDSAPAALGPYSQAIKVNGFVYTSGQIPLDPATGQIVEGGIAAQTRQTLKNLEAVLKASGSDVNKVIKTTVFIKNMDDFVNINEVYAQVFSTHQPARSCVEVARLPKDVLIEIEAVALHD